MTEEGGSDGDTITLRVKDQSGDEMFFKVCVHTSKWLNSTLERWDVLLIHLISLIWYVGKKDDENVEDNGSIRSEERFEQRGTTIYFRRWENSCWSNPKGIASCMLNSVHLILTCYLSIPLNSFLLFSEMQLRSLVFIGIYYHIRCWNWKKMTRSMYFWNKREGSTCNEQAPYVQVIIEVVKVTLLCCR